MHLFPSPKPLVNCIDDLDFFKDFENEFLGFVYNDALTSISNFLTKPTLSPQHINKFDLKDETSLSEYDEVEQNVLYFNDLFPFNIIYLDDLKSDKENDDNEIDMIQSSGGKENTQGSNNLLEGSHNKINKIFNMKSFIMELNVNIVAWNYFVNGMLFNLIKNLYVPFGIPFDPKRYYKDGVYTRMLRRPRREAHRVQVFDFGGLPDLTAEGLSSRMLIGHRFGEAMLDMDTARALQFQLGGARRCMSQRQFILALRLHTAEDIETVRFDAYWAESARKIPDKGHMRDYWIEISSIGDFLGTTLSYTSIRDSILRLCHRLIACSIAGKSQAPEKVTVTDLFYLRGMDVGSVNIPYLLARYLRLFASRRKQGAMISEGQRELLVIDMTELVRLQICEEIDGSPMTREAVEDDVHEIRVALGEQHEVMDVMAKDFSRFTVWAAGGISHLLDYAAATYLLLGIVILVARYSVSAGKSSFLLVTYSCWQACGELLKRRIYRSDLKPFLTNSKVKPNLISLSKMSDHEEETINKENAHPKVVPQITTVTNIFAKFLYLKKGEYDIWAMKMQNFISSSDLLCWNIILKGNSAKSMTTDNDGNLKIRPRVTAEEHQQVQREEKARTILLFALPDELMGDFYHMIDAKDIWNAIKARFGGNVESKKMQKSLLKQKFEEFKIFEEEGLDKGYDKMQKILTQMNTLKINPDPEDVNMQFLRGLPPSWSCITLILKTKGRLEYISFDDLYNKLKFLKIDTKGYSSSSSTLSNAAFVSTAGFSQGNLSYQESGNGAYTTSPSSSSSKGSSKSKCSVVDDVIYSFFVNHKIDQHLVYEDLDQMNKEDFEEYDLKHQMEMLSIKVHRSEKKHGRKIKFNGRENARFDKKLVKCFNCKQMGHFSRKCRAQGGQNSNNYQKYKSKEAGKDRSYLKAMVVVDGSIDWDKQTEGGNTEPRSLENFGMIAGIKVESDDDLEGEVVSADDAIPAGVSVSAGNVVAAIVSPQSEAEFAFMGLSTEAKWNNSGRNLYKLIDSSMSIRTKRGLGLDKYWRRFASVDHMKAVPPPLTGNYMPPSNIPDIHESQMVYEKKATDSSEIKTNDDSISHFNDSVLFDFSDRSLEPSTKTKVAMISLIPFLVFLHLYLHLIKDCDLHEQRFAKRNAEGNGILGRRSTGKPVNPNRPKPVSAGRPNLVSAEQQNPVSAGQPNPVSAGQPNLVSAGKLLLSPQQVGLGQNMDNSLRLEKAKDRGIVDSGCSRSMSGNKDKLEDFKDFDGGEVTFRGST
nr:ribonuclease H-like domain-containing protein [Tanacetum cinerariifolium]